MNFARDSDGRRILPFPSGRGFCRLCDAELIARCGDINVWHWSHIGDRNCDPWKEHETPWHRNWKSRFNKDWQEFIIEDDSERHIADVRTSNGFVVEFQHSSISRAIITEREEFYGNMIWVIDGKPFEPNIKFFSKVRAKTKELEDMLYGGHPDIDREFEPKIKEIKDQIAKNRDDVSRSMRQEKSLMDSINQYESHLWDAESFTKSVLDIWTGKSFYGDSCIFELSNLLSKAFGDGIRQNLKSVSELQENLKVVSKKLQDINALTSREVNGKNYKIVTIGSITRNNYARFVLLTLESSQSLFPQTKTIKDELDLERINYQKDKYIFLVDPSNEITQYTEQITEINKQLTDLIEFIPNSMAELKTAVVKTVRNKIEHLSDEAKSFESETQKLSEDNDRLHELCMRVEAEKKEAKIEADVELKEFVETEKSFAMRSFKGQYRYKWKHRRPSWDKAQCPVFIDRHDGYVYELKTDGYSTRQSYDEFVDYCCKHR